MFYSYVKANMCKSPGRRLLLRDVPRDLAAGRAPEARRSGAAATSEIKGIEF